MRSERARLKLKIVPGSSRTGVAGWLGETLKVRLAAPPERGRANAVLIALLADSLGVPERDVVIVSGQTSPRKTVEVRGLSEAELRERLSQPST